jgi:beta-glucosidase
VAAELIQLKWKPSYRLILFAGLMFSLPAVSIRSQAVKATAPGAIKAGLKGPELDRKVAEILRKMTLEEKVLQLLANPPNGVPRLGIPNLRWGEVLHGVVGDGATAFPQAIAMGSTWDPALIQEMGTVVAKEARALGVQQGYAPMLGWRVIHDGVASRNLMEKIHI